MLWKIWTDRVLIYSVQGKLFNNMFLVRYLHLIKAKPIHKGQTHPFVRDVELHDEYDRKDSVEKKSCGRYPQGAWCQDELIDGKPPVVK
jgi:hypothetical protein